jgi:hypothetical protein
MADHGTPRSPPFSPSTTSFEFSKGATLLPVIPPTRELGAVGIIKDNSPTVIPPNAFSDGINVRFTEKKVSRAPLFRTFSSA